ncbi:PAS domain S-box-containing protein/diguanylate cyclase (GGDEF)-like protein [Luteimonas cucumeris]|uniref:PAS domain S-box-containing protein/diguanylate cyclase (GGDEF)-like protein n=1 Tax=Luteimonas cucumeris TaxID=985012 RepID=A0A562L7G9_9GAMM|nr:EAL domain-containing protein [Luteimonas cucumeris]TWI03627.1 PAS domain S-box-containing protein/diguanylate cyclase (GGDEF)-like protein [Luteimonas cucumeris]
MSTAPPSGNDSGKAVADTLPALERACGDDGLPSATRALLAQASEALRTVLAEAEAARKRYRALFDAVPDPTSILDVDGTVLDLNAAGVAAYQRPRENIVGRPIHVLNPDLPRDHMDPVLEALDRGDSYEIEVTNMRADGTRFPVEVHSANIEYEGRRCILAVARDLSTRWESESRYRLLLESIDKGVILFHADPGQVRVVSANPAAHRIFGVGSSESLERKFNPEDWKIVDENGDELTPAQQPTVRAMQTGQIIESTVLGMFHIPSRQMTWISVTNVPVFSPGGSQPEHVFALFSDVTALKRDNALFDRTQALAHVGGWEWDRVNQQLYLTGEVRRILGRAHPPQTMPELLDCLRPQYRRPLQAALGHLVDINVGFDLELQGQREDGHLLWIRMIGESEAGNPSATRLSGTIQDITQRKQAEDVLRVQARTDPLTGLMNRDAILGELSAMLASPSQNRIAVLYVDLDRFKTVNDVLGHAAGDELLVTAAQRIVGAAGHEGLIARFGGDEFLIVCAIGDDHSRPERLANALLSAFSDGFRFGDDEFTITVSVGIAYAPEDGNRPQQLIQNADAAMYDSKRRVRNGWQAFTPELAQRQQDRLQIETHLRRAADNDEFHLVYQPQVDLRQGRVIAAEALIRWENHQLGEMRPDLFISHAETTGDIVRIGGWVLREACRQVHEWREQGHGIIRVAINVSYRQFLAEDLAISVRDALAEFDLPGSALELEFTERVLIEDAPDTVNTFMALRELGVMLTIDDFGEGYSALNYVRRLPIHGLKLSQLFVQGVPDNQSDVAVCRAVAAIARSLGLGLVAEGVESEAQRQFLLQLGVPVGQGFLFAPGLAPDEFVHRLGRSPDFAHA